MTVDLKCEKCFPASMFGSQKQLLEPEVFAEHLREAHGLSYAEFSLESERVKRNYGDPFAEFLNQKVVVSLKGSPRRRVHGVLTSSSQFQLGLETAKGRRVLIAKSEISTCESA